MDAAIAEELELLRARAYGPDADIHTDQVAQRRLRELEGLSRAREATTPHEAPDSDTTVTVEHTGSAVGVDRRAAEGPTAVAAPDTVDADAEPPAQHLSPTAAPPRRRLSLRLRLLWAASIVATAAIAAAVTYGLAAMTPVSSSSGAPQIATLRPDELVEIPSGWYGAGPSSRAWSFHGLTLFEVSSGMFGAGECVAVVATEEIPDKDQDFSGGWSISGMATTACRIGAFPATIELPVNSSTPEELRAAFPDSFLQFVLRGDRIGVFLDEG